MNPREETGSFVDYGTDGHGYPYNPSELERLQHSQTNPYSNHNNITFHSLGRRSYNLNRTKVDKDFEDKDLLFTAQHKNVVNANHAHFFQSKSSGSVNGGQPIKTASKYFDRHAAALSSMTHHEDVQRTASDGSAQSAFAMSAGSHVPLPTSTKYAAHNNTNESTKSKSKSSSKEKGSSSSFLSKLHNSFSSHNIGAHSSTSGCSSPSGSVSSSSKSSFTKINSKIASLWKRSKSTHDKLDQDALTANPSKNAKASELNRSIPARRSYVKSDKLDMNQNQANIPRSSTYDRLPANEDEASKMNQIETNNNLDLDEDNDERYSAALKKQADTNRFANDSMNGNFTFTTFVRTPSSDIKASGQGSPDKKSKSNKSNKHNKTVANATVDDSSGVSSASSGSSHRKTCLVTTV